MLKPMVSCTERKVRFDFHHEPERNKRQRMTSPMSDISLSSDSPSALSLSDSSISELSSTQPAPTKVAKATSPVISLNNKPNPAPKPPVIKTVQVPAQAKKPTAGKKSLPIMSQLPLSPGRQVAYKPVAKPTKSNNKAADDGGWILARIVRMINGDKLKYEVQDADTEPGNSPP